MWHNMLLATEVDQALNYANNALYTLQSGRTTKIVLNYSAGLQLEMLLKLPVEIKANVTCHNSFSLPDGTDDMTIFFYSEKVS